MRTQAPLPSLAALGLILCSLLGCNPSSGSKSTPTVPPTLPPTWTPGACIGPAITFGEISENSNEVITSMQPLADYLAERLASYGYVCGKVKVVKLRGHLQDKE